MRIILPRVCYCFVCATFIFISGCGRDKTPKGPELGSVQKYLDDNPDIAARVNEDDVESDDDSGDGEDDLTSLS